MQVYGVAVPSHSNLKIISNGLNGSSGSLSSSRPTIQGLAEPESRIRLEIHSATTVVSTGTVITDSDGKWVYFPTKDLPDGSYSVFAYSTDAAGNESSSAAVGPVDASAPGAPVATAANADELSGNAGPEVRGHGYTGKGGDGGGGLVWVGATSPAPCPTSARFSPNGFRAPL